MIFNHRHIGSVLRFLSAGRSLAAALLLAALTAACSGKEDFHEPEIGPVKGASVSFMFTLSDAPVAEPRVESRATPTDGDYDKGAGYENYIDIEKGDFRLYFYTSNDLFFGMVNEVTLLPISESPGSKTYQVRGTVSPEQAALSGFKVCILANWTNYPEPAMGDPLSKLWVAPEALYTHGGNELSRSNLVPLYGIKEFKGITFAENGLTDLGLMHLLRAFAKIEVELTESVRPVKKVSLTRVNLLGYKAPSDVTTEGDYVHGSYEADYVATPHIPSTAVRQDVEMLLVKGDKTKEEFRKFVAYVPEYDNISSSAVKTRIKIEYLDNPFTDTDYLDFKYYEKKGPHAKDEEFDLLRNYLYRFQVTQKRIFVDVQPYAEVLLKPNFGLERDGDGNIVVRNEKGDIIKLVTVDNQQLYFNPFEVANIGQATGVFDQSGNVIMAFLKDGRSMIYNYKDKNHTELMSWEIYTADDNEYGVYLEEEYELCRYDWADESYHDMFCHNFYDDRGCLVEEFRYPSDKAFNERPGKGQGEGVRRTVGYTGELHGEKDIYHYDESGNIFLTVYVRYKDVLQKDENGNVIKDENGNPVYKKELHETYVEKS